MVRNQSSGAGLVLEILCVLIFTLVGCSRRESGSKPGTGDGELYCDAACEADVRSHAVSAGQMKVNDAQWQAAFDAGKAELAKDQEWLGLIAEQKHMVCQEIAHTADRQQIYDLNERIGKRIQDDMLTGANVGHASEAGDSPDIDAARVKVVKLHLIRYLCVRNRHSCPQ
jgi:hypothetical protein